VVGAEQFVHFADKLEIIISSRSLFFAQHLKEPYDIQQELYTVAFQTVTDTV